VDWARFQGQAVVEPSIYAADFARLGEQLEALLAAGTRVFHFDVGDGHFVPPVTIGPVVLRSIAPLVHDAGGLLDCHLMVSDPAHHFPEIAESGGDSVTFHAEATDDPAGVAARARELGLAVGIAFKPATAVEDAADVVRAAVADLALCMSIEPGYSGQAFMPEALDRIRTLRSVLPETVPVQVDGGIGPDNIRKVYDAGTELFVAGTSIFAREDLPRAYRRLLQELS
jgi:ribulose-phosphate 3-epimerase